MDNTFFPVKIVSWQKAIVLLLTGRAEVVVEYEDKTIRSVNFDINLPKILRLNSRHRAGKKIKFNRTNVFLRDEHRCQYCHNIFRYDELTIDHVLPVSRGGPTTWQNVVASCARCNTKKGAKTPREAGMKLYKEPKEPNWSPHIYLRIKTNDPPEWTQWFQSPKKMMG
ncbi:MAG: HNH endonuclease [Bacteriovoracaceae bacterium]